MPGSRSRFRPNPNLSRPVPVDTTAWARYGRGEQFLTAIGEGRAARAVWQALPGENWAQRLSEAAAVALNAGLGVVAVVPDQSDVDALYAAATERGARGAGGRVVGRSRPVRPLPPLAGGVARACPGW